MTAAGGQNLAIRVAVLDAASVPAEKIAASMGGIGAAAVEGSKAATTALAQVDAALAGSAANAIKTGEANAAGAAASASAWTGAGTAAVTALDRLSASAQLAQIKASEAMTKYLTATQASADGSITASAAAQKFGLQATIAAADAQKAMDAYTAAATASTAASAAAGEASAAGAAESASAWTRAAAVMKAAAETTAEVFAAESAVGVKASEDAGIRTGRAFGMKLGETAKATAAPILETLGIFAAAAFVKESIGAATDEETSIQRLNLVFGDGAEVVKKWSETSAKAFNYTGAAADTMASDFGNAFSAANITGEQAATMSTSLVGVVADIAKASGKSRGEVEGAVQDAIKGRPKLLQQMGIAFDSATIKQEALNHAIGNGVAPLNATQKALVDYFTLMDGASKSDGGAYAAANDMTANKMDKLAMTADQLKISVGSGLLPIMGSFADVASNGVVPALDAILWPFEKVLGLFGKLPSFIQSGVVGFGILLALKGPIGTFFDFLILKSASAAEAMGAEGLATSMLGLAGAMGPIVAIAGGVAIAIATLTGSDKSAAAAADNHASAVENLSQALERSNGLIDENVRTSALNTITSAKWGDSSTDLTTYSDNLKSVGVDSRDLVDDMLAIPGASDKVESAYKRQAAAIKAIIEANTRTVTSPRGTAHFENDEARAADARLKILNQQHDAFTGLVNVEGDAADKAKENSAAVKVANDSTTTTLTAVTEAVDTLTAGWASMDDEVNTVIATLDKLAGKDIPVEQAVSNMYKQLKSSASLFKVGQQGAEILDPSKIYKADGTLDTRSTAGQNLLSLVTGDKTSIVTAASAAYDQEYAKSHDLLKAKQAAAVESTSGIDTENLRLTSIFGGNKGAADDFQKRYGNIASGPHGIDDQLDGMERKRLGLSGTTTMTVIANTNQADAALTALGAKVAAVTGAPNPATTPATPGAAPSAAGVITATGPVLPGSANSAEHDAASGILANSLAPGNSAYNEQVPTGGSQSGTKYASSVERWRSLGLQSLALMGEPASEIDSVLYRINLESTGDPTAQNNWDSNAQKGTPSKGLVQVIQPTFDQYHLAGYDNIWDPLSNLLAGENYSKHAYGSVAAGFNKAGGYDNGGWLKPGGVAFSALATPEPILTTAQWKVAEMAINHASNNAGKTLNVHPGAIVIHGVPDGNTKEALREEIRQIMRDEVERAF